MAKITELLTRRHASLGPGATLAEAARAMLDGGLSSLLVVGDGRLLGIVTERDLVHALRTRGGPAQPLGALMSSPVHVAPPDQDWRDAYRDSVRHGCRHIVVAGGDGQPLGVVSESEVIRHLGSDFFRRVTTVDALMERLFPCLPPDAPLSAALAAMEAQRASCAVIAEARRPVGILTEGDVARLLLSPGDDPPLAEVMTPGVVALPATASLGNAVDAMARAEIRHLVALDGRGEVAGILSEHTLLGLLGLDVADEVQAERQSLERSRDQIRDRLLRHERYQSELFDNFPFPVWLKDTDSRFLAVNRRYAETAGRAAGETLIGQSDFDLWPQELAEHSRAEESAVMAERRRRTGLEALPVGRTRIWHEVHRAPVVGADGAVLGTVGFALDVSGHKRDEEAIVLRSAALAGLARNEPLNGILELIALSVEREIPDGCCAILLADADGRTLQIGAAPSLSDAERRSIADIAADAADDGSGHRCVPIVGAAGRRLGIVVIHPAEARPGNDADFARLLQAAQLAALVIDHQQAARRLENSLETFRGIFDSTSEALFVIDAGHRLLAANAMAGTLGGYPRDALVGHCYRDFAAPGLNDLAAIDRRIDAAFGGSPQAFEYWIRDAQGRIFPCAIRLHPGRYFEQPAVIASAFDATEQKAAALRLEIDNALSHAIAAGARREDVLDTLLRAALHLPEFETAAIYRRDAGGNWLRLAQRGRKRGSPGAPASYPPASPFEAAVREGRPAVSCRPGCPLCTGSSLVEAPAFAGEQLRSLALLPIGDNGDCCLKLASRQRTGLSTSTQLALEALQEAAARSLLQLAAHEEATRQQRNLSGLFDTVRDFIFIVDRKGRILHHNRAVAEQLGYADDALRGRTIAVLYPKAQRRANTAIVADLVAGQRKLAALPLLNAAGQPVTVEVRVATGRWNGHPAWFGIAHDIGERLAAEERQKLAASVFDNAHEGIMITDPHGRIVEVNATFSELTGYAREEALGQTADLLKSGHHDAAFYDQMWRSLREDGFWRGEIWNRKKSGELIVEALTISTVRNREGEISHFVGIFSDITLLKQHQQRLEHLAHFDALTQLPNRMLLGDRMQLAMAQAERNGKLLAVCYLDLDGFKPINDAYGHAVGDHLLIEVAQRLKSCLRAGDTVARLGGDEFVLLFGDLEGVHESERAIGRAIAALSQPFHISDHMLALSASIGVTLFPQDGADADTLLRHADQAMYAAKQAGRNRYHLFDPEHDRRARARRDEISRIRSGLADGEFVLYYQPKVNMREGSVVGAEALIRWQHPERGLLLPQEFLPAIENTELAVELGDWVIDQALRQIAEWDAQGIALSVSINIAGNHLQHPGFPIRLAEQLAHHAGVSPSRLELEVLETAALEDMSNVARLFEECRELGISFALDDFGTGYSSLTYFRRLPADILKIDQSFVRDMLDDPEDLAIVEGVIGLTQAFQRQVIAEGVESVEHGLVLLRLGCDLAQGYGIARPMPAGAMPEWVRTFRPDALWRSPAAESGRDSLPLLIAELDHQRWKKMLFAWLAGAPGQAEAPGGDHHDCRFGRWLYSQEGQRHAAVDAFRELETAHRRAHEIGNALIERKRAGDGRDPAPLLAELEAASGKIGDCLRRLRNERRPARG